TSTTVPTIILGGRARNISQPALRHCDDDRISLGFTFPVRIRWHRLNLISLIGREQDVRKLPTFPPCIKGLGTTRSQQSLDCLTAGHMAKSRYSFVKIRWSQGMS